MMIVCLTSVMAYNMAFYGDSITKAGVSTNGGYSKLVSSWANSNLQTTVYTNYGINGLKVYNLTWVIDSCNSKNYTQIFIMIGTNDRYSNMTTYTKNLDTVVQKAKKCSKKVILLAIPPTSYGGERTVNSNIYQYALKSNTTYLDIHKAFAPYGYYNTSLFADGLHPNNKGQEVIANYIKSCSYKWK